MIWNLGLAVAKIAGLLAMAKHSNPHGSPWITKYIYTFFAENVFVNANYINISHFSILIDQAMINFKKYRLINHSNTTTLLEFFKKLNCSR
jgi:hypothetical protein